MQSTRRPVLAAVLIGVLTLAACQPEDAHQFGEDAGVRYATTTTVAPAPGEEPPPAPQGQPPVSDAPEPVATQRPATPVSNAPSAPPVSAAPATTAAAPAVPMSEVEDCVTVVPLGAVNGNELLAAMWSEAGQDMAAVRAQCEALGASDPGALNAVSRVWAGYKEAARRAARRTPYPCDPNYTPCVADDPTDVDCVHEPGSDGPTVMSLPVLVIGADEYALDVDGDGFGCEPGQF